MISDVHYSERPFRGQDQSKVFEWLYEIVKKEKPGLLLSAGDFGPDVTSDLFDPVLESVHLLTIYGNHDNVELIQTLRNRSGAPCWLQDGLIRNCEGLKVAGINGNIAQVKRKVHHKTIEDIHGLISKYAYLGKEIDVLITHEAPKLESISRDKVTLGYEVFNEAVEILKPMLHLCGHVHIPSQILKLNSTTLLNLDSSTRHREYVIAGYETGKLYDVKIVSPKS